MRDGETIKPLTSLRFFAALWVVLYAYWPDLATRWTPLIVQRGYLGVELFFTLSGFILCHVYLSRVEGGRFQYRAFLWARLSRIYPLHLATLAIVGVAAGAAIAAGRKVDPNILAWSALPANLLLVHAWGFAKVAGWNHSSWSISAEWFAYLCFPGFAWAALRLQRRPWLGLFGALVLLSVVYAAFEALARFPLTEATIAWGALRIVPCFLLGCATFLVWRYAAADRRKPSALAAAIAGAASAIAVQMGAPDAMVAACFAGLIFTLANLGMGSETLASHPVFVYLGEISYSTYMIFVPWQLVFVNIVVGFLHLPAKILPWYIWLIFVGCLAPLSAASYHLVENPARQGMKRWAKRPMVSRPATVSPG
ncbi:MAG TPA: acyltransferase [Caulobacteraceae bacterium]